MILIGNIVEHVAVGSGINCIVRNGSSDIIRKIKNDTLIGKLYGFGDALDADEIIGGGFGQDLIKMLVIIDIGQWENADGDILGKSIVGVCSCGSIGQLIGPHTDIQNNRVRGGGFGRPDCRSGRTAGQ